MIIVLSQEGREALFKINGSGGAQNFQRQLQAQFNSDTNELTYSEADLEKAREIAAWAGGDGGFQGRMRKIFAGLI